MFFQKIKESFGKTPCFFQLGWILVILGSIALRFVGIDGRAWGYDEFSAVFRAISTSNDFQSHLERGVTVDGHPAGLQTIIWWWISVAGSDVLWPRILTALFSIGVLWQFHRMAKTLFGFEAAFWAVAMMGLMWWQANMGIWIRPYIFALPFVLGSWNLVLGLLKNRDSNGDVVLPDKMGWFALKLGGALAGAAYFHYFAGLTAGASFIALLLIHPKIPTNPSKNTQGLHPSYILFLPLTFAFLFYLPHLPLTFAQFQLGGLGWLNQPTPQFLWQFLQFATGHSLPILILFVGSILYALQFHIRIAYLPKPASFKRILQQPTLLLTLGFLLVFAFGYTYSVVRAPILQNNALYFAFPLLILVAATGITNLRNQMGDTQNGINGFEKYTQPLAILLPTLLLFNTLYQKQFLTLERKGTHHRIVEQSLQFAENQTQSNRARGTNSDLHVWLDGPADNYQFHRSQILHKHKFSKVTPTEYFESHGPTLPFIAQQLQSLKPGAQVFLGLQSGSQPWLLPLIESHFNHTSRYQGPITSTSQAKLPPTKTREKSKNKRESPKPNTLAHEFLIGGEWLTLAEPREPQFTPKDFHLTESQPINNTTDTTLLSTTIEVSHFNPSPDDVILIVVKTDDCRGDIETSLWNQTQQIDWRSTKIADYQQAGFKYAIHAIKLADIPNWNQQTLLRVRIGAASRCLIGKYLGNPNLYGVQL
ncbi:MAG: hypothetical protein O2814_07475 [Bacteroidetes bacterium]|nr:hypothetical protein [Bacteroidota bacterium]MDA1224284.1 hypothetical protein [Bacteroidota bacterium]